MRKFILLRVAPIFKKDQAIGDRVANLASVYNPLISRNACIWNYNVTFR